MKRLSQVINYINNKIKEFVTIEEINTIVNFDELSQNEIVEIFRAIINHNRNINNYLQEETEKNKTHESWLQFNGYHPQKEITNAPKTHKNTNEAEFYIELFKSHLNNEEITQILSEIYNLNNAEQIILELILYLQNEKTSIIKMLYETKDQEDQILLNDELREIDNKIATIQSYSLETLEENIEMPKNAPIVLLRLPSGNIGILKDIASIKDSFYNEPEYYQDLLELLEAVKTGKFISIKKLRGIDSYEDRNYQIRLSFSFYNGMIILTSLFVKKSDNDAGVYSTLKSRLKLFNRTKNSIVPNEEDIQILDSIIADLKTSLSKRGESR